VSYALLGRGSLSCILGSAGQVFRIVLLGEQTLK
jgi:hypothetical protein